MENVYYFKKNFIALFLVISILYFLMMAMFYRPQVAPSIMRVTQDSSCFTPEGWPTPCE